MPQPKDRIDLAASAAFLLLVTLIAVTRRSIAVRAENSKSNPVVVPIRVIRKAMGGGNLLSSTTTRV